MYSRMAGTGEGSASSGSQILAASRPPPETGMKTFSMSWTRRGKELTVLMFLLAYPRSILRPGRPCAWGVVCNESKYSIMVSKTSVDAYCLVPLEGDKTHRAPGGNSEVSGG